MSAKLAYVCDGCTSQIVEPIPSGMRNSPLVEVMTALVPKGWLQRIDKDGTSMAHCPGCQPPDVRRWVQDELARS